MARNRSGEKTLRCGVVTATGGIRFGQYVLLRRIARGGMAEVFLAQQRGLEGFDRRVAVKRILPHLADSPDFVKMFLGEAKLAAQLTHPNIVHIYEFGKVASDYFIAMEFVDGVHAGHVFKHDERMPPTLVARIGADAAAALHYAHELRGANGKALDLVHRDVSPANIMVSFDGTVRLCDFGIAKAAMLSDQLTNPGQVKGKYAYMSPEQTIASQLDGRSDVFSLSIVLWELLVGKTIVSRGDAVEAMRSIRDGKLVPLSRAAPNLPRPLAAAIDWGLETKRERRATAAELAQALEAFIKSSPELATPMQLGAWVRARFVREGTGELPSLDSVDTPRGEPQGTIAVPGTSVASPSTTVGTSSALIAASRSTEVDEGAETIFSGPPSMTGERGNNTTIAGGPLVITGENSGTTIAASPLAFAGDTPLAPPPAPTASPSSTTLPFGDSAGVALPPNASTLPLGRAPSQVRPDLTTSPLGPRNLRPDEEPTNRAGRPRRAPTERGHDRGPVVEGSLRSTRERRPAIGRADTASRATSTGYEPTADVRRSPVRAPKRVVVVAVLALLALASFLIVVATHSPARTDTPPADAAPQAVIVPDAAVVMPPAVDAPVDTEVGVVVDAPQGPTPTTLLEVRTQPSGATVKVGDQTRLAPAQLALPAGHYVVIAELPGYQSERREVDLPFGEHLMQEIVFAKKTSTPSHPVPAMGRLTARSTPYSDVFLNGKKLGETPFADLEIAPGTYTLVFKNPDRPPVARRPSSRCRCDALADRRRRRMQRPVADEPTRRSRPGASRRCSRADNRPVHAPGVVDIVQLRRRLHDREPRLLRRDAGQSPASRSDAETARGLGPALLPPEGCVRPGRRRHLGWRARCVCQRHVPEAEVAVASSRHDAMTSYKIRA
jgi:serine/threonine-protein kinase